MARKTYSTKENDVYKQMKIKDGLYTDATIGESDYMAVSPIWQQLREERLKRDNQRCVQCGAPYPLNVHHRRYPAVWGMESIDDLVTLCDKCHANAHNKKEEK